MTTLEQAATQMINLRPGSPDGYALRAISYINRKQFATAETDARKAIEVGPQSQLGYVQMGDLKFVQTDTRTPPRLIKRRSTATRIRPMLSAA